MKAFQQNILIDNNIFLTSLINATNSTKPPPLPYALAPLGNIKKTTCFTHLATSKLLSISRSFT